MKTQFYYNVAAEPGGGGGSFSRGLTLLSQMSARVYLLIRQSAVRLDGERRDSAVTPRLCVSHQWTRHTVRPRRVTEELPAAVSPQPSVMVGQWESERWVQGEAGDGGCIPFRS